MVNALLNIGDYYEKSNLLDSARIYTQQANELALSIKDEPGIGWASMTLGNIYTKMTSLLLPKSFTELVYLIFLNQAKMNPFARLPWV
jgi:hypothetical protein